MQPVFAGCFLHCQEVLRLKKGKDQNYLDFVPVKNAEIEYHADEKGKVTLLIEWKGFYAKIAQKFFHRPRVSAVSYTHLRRGYGYAGLWDLRCGYGVCGDQGE